LLAALSVKLKGLISVAAFMGYSFSDQFSMRGIIGVAKNIVNHAVCGD
jgi:hypothetical protein